MARQTAQHRTRPDEVGWHFPGNGGGQVAGFNDSGIETFAGQPFESLAREIIQNSLDARASEDNAVAVCFELEEIPTADFPAHDEMLGIMEKCLQASRDDQKAREFFGNAVKILLGHRINCLKILDYNTTGLRDGKGDDVRSGQWHRLIKATGKPQTERLAGGSFGIGKNAPFAVSDLRMVFYYTRYNKNGTSSEYAQGKAILVSHELSDEEETQAVGFFGVKKNCDRLAGDKIPKILKRGEKVKEGTTILIPGLSEVHEWEKRIVAAIISNFFFAIDDKKLVVIVEARNGDRIFINHKHLPKLLGHRQGGNSSIEAEYKSLHGLWEDDGVVMARAYYQALKQTPVEEEIRHLGRCVLWLAEEFEFPQSVAVLRRGMKITNRLLGLIRWPACADFAAVCVCYSDSGNALLRGMENPAHDAFEHERLGERSKEGKMALKELAKWIRSEVKKITEKPAEKPFQLDKMRDFFPSEEDTLPGEGIDKSFEGAATILLRPTSLKPTAIEEFDDDENNGGDDAGGNRGEHGEDGKVDGHNGKAGNGAGEDSKRAVVPAMDIAFVRVLRTENERVKRVNFTPKQTGRGALSLQIAGDSFTEKVNIKDIKGPGISKEGGRFVLAVEKDKRVTVEIELPEPINSSVSITLKREKEYEMDGK